jgi:SAM-dependent methyltransferase
MGTISDDGSHLCLKKSLVIGCASLVIGHWLFHSFSSFLIYYFLFLVTFLFLQNQNIVNFGRFLFYAAVELNCYHYFKCNPTNNILYSCDNDLEFFRCRDCGMIWRSPESMTITRPYTSDYFDSKNYLRRREHKIRKSGWLLDIARSDHPGITEMLEVGCSVGNTLEAAGRRNIAALGIDVSEYAITFCRENGLNAKNKTLEELLNEGQHFDLVFMQHVLEHFTNPFEVLSTCHQLLKDKGILLIMVPNSKFRPAMEQREQHRFYSKEGVGTEHFVYFDYSNLSRTLQISGFEVVQKNYPLWGNTGKNLLFFVNRIFRRSLALIGNDQELLVVARKK